jgi:hypothetical protein
MSNKMSAKEKSQAAGLQMVEIDQVKFAVEVKDGEVCANLAQMAKSFGKQPKDWLRTRESKAYIGALSDRRKCLSTDLVRVNKGGASELQGTWAYDRNIVIEFARWLNPAFSIQVNELVWQLITGQAEVRKLGESKPSANSADTLVQLVEQAAALLGSQNAVAKRGGFPIAILSHLRHNPQWVSGERRRYIEHVCRQIIEGFTRSHVDRSGVMADILRIDDRDVRISLYNQLAEGGVL